MDDQKISRLSEDSKELERLLESATRPRVKDFLSVEIRRLQTEISQERAKGENVESTKANNDTPVQKSYAPYDVQVKNYSWDQSDKFVKIYLTGLSGASSLPENSVVTKFGAKSVDVRVENLNGKNHCLSIKETAENILPEKSYYKIKTDMVLLMLCKASSGTDWSHLRAVEKAAAKSKFKSPAMEEDKDPSAGIMNMMKQMYEEGDDEMKRTIAKAWTESRDKKQPTFDDL